MALYPPPAQGEGAPPWLEQALGSAPRAIAAGTVQVETLPKQGEDQGQGSRLLLVPLNLASRMTEAFVVPVADEAQFAKSRQTLEATALLLALGPIQA